MFRNLFLAAFLVCGLAAASQQAAAQTPFVIVPDTPGGGSSAAGNEAIVTTNLNMRSGPGTRYGVLTVLQRGDVVRVHTCDRGWCNITFRRQRGWVSQNYLARPVGGGGGGPIVRPPPREVCFFEETRFRGRSFCALPGESQADLGNWRNRIASITVGGFPTVQVCVERNFSDCDAFNEDVPVLPWWLERNISSFRVFH